MIIQKILIEVKNGTFLSQLLSLLLSSIYISILSFSSLSVTNLSFSGSFLFFISLCWCVSVSLSFFYTFLFPSPITIFPCSLIFQLQCPFCAMGCNFNRSLETDQFWKNLSHNGNFGQSFEKQNCWKISSETSIICRIAGENDYIETLKKEENVSKINYQELKVALNHLILNWWTTFCSDERF